jgi:predicted HTH domain antitoxin
VSVAEDVAILKRIAYSSEKEFMEDALRALLEKEPKLRVELAVVKFVLGKVSLNKAAEIAGLTSEEFKAILKSRGIKRNASFLPKNSLKKN